MANVALEQDVQRGKTSPELEATPPVREDEASTRFNASGPVPGVSATTDPARTASELAFEKGPGVRALEALLAAGAHTPKQVVELIDAHRDESAAMFVLVEAKLGAGFATEVRHAMGLRASIARKEVVAGDPTNANGGFFVASAKEQGAHWQTADKRFTGTANQDGLDSTYRVDDNDSVHAHVDKKGEGTVGWEHDGKTVGELYHGKSETGLRRTWELGGGANLGTGLRNRSHDGGSTNEAFASYKSANGELTADGAVGVRDGKAAEHLAATYKPSDRDTISGRVDHDVTGTHVTADASHRFTNGDTLSGHIDHAPTGTHLTADATHHLDNGATISGHGDLSHGPKGTTGQLAASYHHDKTTLGASVTQGAGQTTMHLSERYQSGNLVQSADLEAGRGAHDYLSATTGLDAKLAPNLYGGAFGGFRAEDGHQTAAQLGASLTFTPNEKAALTLAGILDQSGNLETRLQLDVFKSKIGSVGDLAGHKKDALVSLFVSYSTGANRHMLDERFGAPTMSTTPDPHVMAGIKIKF
jgi:hypothetical protein